MERIHQLKKGLFSALKLSDLLFLCIFVHVNAPQAASNF